VAEACRWLSSWLDVDPGQRTPIKLSAIERPITIPEPMANDRFATMVARWCRVMRPGWMQRAAELLGLPAEPLVRLCVGWSPEHSATTWPMRDDAGWVIGVRLRCPKSARKWAVQGSRAGLIFDPELLAIERPKRLWIVEGPTDTAALLSIGLEVVGVPSAGGGADLLERLARRLRPESMVIVADADGPGQGGAERLADRLMIVAPLSVIVPPIGVKDPRAWIAGGADRATVEVAADAAPVRCLSVEGASHE
jgi:hypothetical protein